MNSQNLWEIYSKFLFEETGIVCEPGTAYGDLPYHIIIDIHNNFLDEKDLISLRECNKKFFEIIYSDLFNIHDEKNYSFDKLSRNQICA